MCACMDAWIKPWVQEWRERELADRITVCTESQRRKKGGRVKGWRGGG